jgi:hypothetical protein
MFAFSVCAAMLLCVKGTVVCGAESEPISPKDKPIVLFNGKNLDGLYTWLSDSKYEDPQKVFTVQDGMLRISGERGGYICTKDRYKNYHLVLEFRWGDQTWGNRTKSARDSGIIVHCADPDGSYSNVFMAGIEAQIIEGGTGDFIVVPGKKADGTAIPVSLAAETTKDRDGETVWKKGAERTKFESGRINWFGRDPDWNDTLGFRGKQDIEKIAKEWNRLDVICDGGHILYYVNGVLANEGFDSEPSSGKILIQSELAELFVRRFELLPLDSEAAAVKTESEPISPKDKPIALFNGKNLDGLYTWLNDAKYEDPRKVFTVENGQIHISGNGFGYVCTKDRYKDYHLVAEYRWGEKAWANREKAARDSGIIVHCAEPDGSFGNTFMAGIEAQIIEGGTGDFLLVTGKRADGTDIPVSLTAEMEQRGGAKVWHKGAERKTFKEFVRIDWYGRDPEWKDTLGFRGKQDLDSPGQEWTRLDVICDGGHVIYLVNGKQANEAFDVTPSSGKILFQTEGAEVFVRRLELLPLERKP